MKPILFLCSDCEFKGGGQVSLLELTKRISRSRYAPFAIVGGAGALQDRFNAIGIPASTITMPRISFFSVPAMFSAIRKLIGFIRQNGISLIHSNDSRAHVYAGIASLFFNIPAVFHYRVSYSDGIYDRILPLFCKRIIAVSNAVGRRFPLFRKKVAIVHNCVDIDRFRPEEKPAISNYAPGCNPVVASIGRLGREKGFATLIEAISLLRKDFPSIGLVLVGQDIDRERPAFNRLISEKGMDKQVFQVDYCSDIPDLMHSIDVYALLSVNEGLNRSILEAMACGKPVITTRVGGNPEIITDGSMGILVPPEDPVAAANALIALLKDTALQTAMARTARKRVETAFSMRMHVENIEAIFDGLLKTA